MKTILEIISDKLKGAFAACGYEERFGQVTVSNRPDLCQYQCNGAMAAAKQYKKAPVMIANEVVEKIGEDPLFAAITAVPPGFLNMNISDAAMKEYLDSMVNAPKHGYEPKHTGETAIIDYGGANVAKPLHIGHLRPAIIGEAVKRLLTFDGYEAIGDVHLGDWGLQIGLIMMEVKRRKPELPYFDENYTGEYPKEAPFTISELEEIYPAASAYSKEHEEFYHAAKAATNELQNGRPGYVALWQHILSVSIEDLRKNYDNLNVHFELWKKESDANPYIADMVEDMKAKGVAHISEGALVVDVKEESDTKEMPPCIILKSDGSALYASTDLATLVEREKLYHPDSVVYVTDKRQSLHFEQVFRTAKKAGIVRPETRLVHLGNGTMNGKDGKPFKTRSGGVYRLEYLIRDVVTEVESKMTDRDMSDEEKKQISAKVGLAALKYGDLANQAAKDYIFDIEKFSSFEGNTGPYILYTMVRIKSILEKYCAAIGCSAEALKEEAAKGSLKISGTDREISASERNLMLGVMNYAESLGNASAELAPHKVCSYIYELSNLFNSFYHDNKIIAEEDKEKQREWIALIMLVLDVLAECIGLLAIEVPDKM